MSEITKFTDTEQIASLMIDLSKIAETTPAQNITLALKFLSHLPVEAYTALKHIDATASSEDWQKLTHQIARTLVNIQYEIAHRQIIEHIKVDNLHQLESDDDILAAALELTSQSSLGCK